MRRLLEVNGNLVMAAERDLYVRPTIRLVAPGTFSDFRHWRGMTLGVGSTQVKLPTILGNPEAQEYILSRVVGKVL